MARRVSSALPSSRSADHSRRSSRASASGRVRSQPSIRRSTNSRFSSIVSSRARSRQARLVGVDHRLQDAPAVAGPLGAEGDELAAAGLAEQLLLARRERLVLLGLVPAVGVLGEEAQVEHREQAGRRDEVLADPHVHPEGGRGPQAALRRSSRRSSRPKTSATDSRTKDGSSLAMISR